MQVVVKKPRIRVEGEITETLIEYLRCEFGDIEIIEEKDEEWVEVVESDWYRSIRPTISPGENIRVYRELHNLTEGELAKKLGNLSRQNISNMECGLQPISKAVAKKMAVIFDVSAEKFL